MTGFGFLAQELGCGLMLLGAWTVFLRYYPPRTTRPLPTLLVFRFCWPVVGLVVHACGDHVTMRGSPVPFVFNQVLYWRWKVQACGTGMVTVLL